MKKNLLIFISLLITVSIPAQEVSRNVNLKSLRQGFNAQPNSLSRTISPVLKAATEGTGFKCDSIISYNYSSETDSVFFIVQYLRTNHEGIRYFSDNTWPPYDEHDKVHGVYNEMGNILSVYGKTSPINEDKYLWTGKEEYMYDSIGNKTQYQYFGRDNDTGIWDTYTTQKWYYPEEINSAPVSYD